MLKLSEDEMDAPVEIVVTSRNVDVSDHFRLHITQRLVRLERYDSNMIRYDVELDHENNTRQSKASQRVALLGHDKGGTVRAEARGPTLHPRSTPQSPSWRRGCDEARPRPGTPQPTPADSHRAGRSPATAGMKPDYAFQSKDLAVLLALELTSRPTTPTSSHQHHLDPPPH